MPSLSKRRQSAVAAAAGRGGHSALRVRERQRAGGPCLGGEQRAGGQGGL